MYNTAVVYIRSIAATSWRERQTGREADRERERVTERRRERERVCEREGEIDCAS